MLNVKSNSRVQASSLPPPRKYYLHIASELTVHTDDDGAMFSDLAAAHRCAVSVISSCMRSVTEVQHWRGWHVKITDDAGRTLVIVLFPAVQRKAFDPHGASG